MYIDLPENLEIEKLNKTVKTKKKKNAEISSSTWKLGQENNLKLGLTVYKECLKPLIHTVPKLSDIL